MTAVIELDGVGKRYQKLDEQAMLLKSLLPFARPVSRELWALRDITLSLAEGETLGVLGHNGAGKTTLLRLLSGVTRPTEGRLRVVGRIAPLISLGIGFHPEMSGRENVLVNGLLLGLSSKEVAKRFDEIVAFSELEDFIDTPVKFYSSGMTMRLGFAVVAHVDPRILLVDEILAVGDASFQFKCFERLRTLQRSGATIVMVSHSMNMIRQLCRRAIVVRHGRVQYDGPIEEAIARHSAMVLSEDPSWAGAVDFGDVRLTAGNGGSDPVQYDEPIEVALRLCFHRVVEDPVIAVGLVTTDGVFGGFNATPPGQRWRTFAAGEEAVLRIIFPARLPGGEYRIAIDVKERNGVRALARTDNLVFTVADRNGSNGLVDLHPYVELDTLS